MILRAKELISRKDRNAEKLRKAATLLERTTRRRTGNRRIVDYVC